MRELLIVLMSVSTFAGWNIEIKKYKNDQLESVNRFDDFDYADYYKKTYGKKSFELKND